MSVTFQGLAPLVVSAVEDDSDEAPTHIVPVQRHRAASSSPARAQITPPRAAGATPEW